MLLLVYSTRFVIALHSLWSTQGQPGTNQKVENGGKHQTRRRVHVGHKERNIATHEKGNGQGNKHFELQHVGLVSTNDLSGKGSNITGNSRIVGRTTQVGRVDRRDGIGNAIGNGGTVKDPIRGWTLAYGKIVRHKQKGGRHQKGSTRILRQVVRLWIWNEGTGNGRSGNVTGQYLGLKFEKVETAIGESNGARRVGARDGGNRLFGRFDKGTLEATAVNVATVECQENAGRDTKLDGKCRSASSRSDGNGRRISTGESGAAVVVGMRFNCLFCFWRDREQEETK